MSSPKKATKTTSSASVLTRLGLTSQMDLVLHFPLRYEDETRVMPIARARAGQSVQIEAEVTHSEVLFRPRRQLVATVRDDSGQIQLRWLNFYPSQREQMQSGKRWRIRGEVRHGFHTLEMVHPKVSVCNAPLSTTLTAIYPSADGLGQKQIANAVRKAIDSTTLDEVVSAEFYEPLGLMPFARAVHILHAPTPAENLDALESRTHPAWVRVKFDELLAQQLSLATARYARHHRQAIPLKAPVPAQVSLTEQLMAQLAFTLTNAQTRCLDQIHHDMTLSYPMHRLLQGDVSSGKTIVAMMAALRAVENGKQAAIMAPTEILSEQLFQKFHQWSELVGIRCVWLYGALGARQKRETLAQIVNGEAHLIVGTQALIQQGVAFHDLGLAIIDEQHRFGVMQRLTLSEKANIFPHQLSMSATPIPRTLAMTFFADLDVSVIDERPPGRTPIVTKLINQARRDEVIAGISNAIEEGGQIYWVCPLIEESETLELQTATLAFEMLQEALPHVRIGLVHGRLPAAQKSEVMRAFAEHELDLLVTTTVIEVGVDVPNAALMVIEDAQRFGLAQLHQLRGRVGRGERASICVLMFEEPLSKIARERLRAMYETDDGFKIAERDLQLRGPGEFLGARQSGLALLRFADYQADAYWVEQARALATKLLENHPESAQAHLDRWMPNRHSYLNG